MERAVAVPTGGWPAAMKRFWMASVFALLLLLPFHAHGAFQFALKSSNAKWVAAENLASNNPGYLIANRNSPISWELFFFSPLGGGYYAIRNVSTGKYVAADLNKGGQLIADRSSVGPWEKFQFILQSGGQFSLKASNGKYVAADYGAGGILIANRATAGPWEKFGLYWMDGRIPCPPAPFCPVPWPTASQLP